MKIKSTKRKRKTLLNKNKLSKLQGELIIVKCKSEEPQVESDGGPAINQDNAIGVFGLDIQIKEEPEVYNISERLSESGPSNHNIDTEDSGAITPKSEQSQVDIEQKSANLKVEQDFEPDLVGRIPNVVVKEETTCFKEESTNDEGNLVDGQQIHGAGDGESDTVSSTETFPCLHCSISFTSVVYLEKHFKWVHQKQYLDNLKRRSTRSGVHRAATHSCSVCHHTFQTRAQLKTHSRQAHPAAPPRRLYPCPTCARSFQYLKNLRNHCQRRHKMSVYIRDGQLRCTDCRKSFKTTWGQGPHRCHELDDDTKPCDRPISLETGVPCLECGKVLCSPQSLEIHMRTHTGDKPYVCKECGKNFSESSSCRKHMLIHTGQKPHKCQECGRAFARVHHLKYHMTTHSGKKEYSCSECGKQFGLKSSLKTHLRSHTGEKPFGCPVCGKCFSTSRNMKVHSKLHSSDKGHQCGECGLKISDLGALKRHLRTHTGERPYHCTVCGNNFIRLAHLKNHQRTHTGEKPYKCTECTKSFIQSGDLARHKRTHAGEKPFQCPECPRSYVASGDLSKHMRIHTNVRPYTCKECAKRFRLSGHLKAHMLTHTGEKPYACPRCLRRFARTHHLSGHVARCR